MAAIEDQALQKAYIHNLPEIMDSIWHNSADAQTYFKRLFAKLMQAETLDLQDYNWKGHFELTRNLAVALRMNYFRFLADSTMENYLRMQKTYTKLSESMAKFEKFIERYVVMNNTELYVTDYAGRVITFTSLDRVLEA